MIFKILNQCPKTAFLGFNAMLFKKKPTILIGLNPLTQTLKGNPLENPQEYYKMLARAPKPDSHFSIKRFGKTIQILQ